MYNVSHHIIYLTIFTKISKYFREYTITWTMSSLSQGCLKFLFSIKAPVGSHKSTISDQLEVMTMSFTSFKIWLKESNLEVREVAYVFCCPFWLLMLFDCFLKTDIYRPRWQWSVQDLLLFLDQHQAENLTWNKTSQLLHTSLVVDNTIQLTDGELMIDVHSLNITVTFITQHLLLTLYYMTTWWFVR